MKKQKTKHNLENTSLSHTFSPNHYLALLPNPDMHILYVCLLYAGPGLMCFRSAAEGQKAFREKGCELHLPLQRGKKSLNGRGTKAGEQGEGEGPEEERESLRVVLDLDLNL